MTRADGSVKPDITDAGAMTVLARDVGAVGEARRWLGEFLEGRVTDNVATDAGLVLSELVTNALRHGIGRVVVRTSLDRRALHVSVSDSSTAEPLVQPREPGRIGGLGLHIVDELSRAWGVASHPTGKTVWATLPRSG